MTRSATRRLAGLLFYAVLALFTAVVLFPFYWLLASSVKTQDQLFTIPPLWVPTAPTLGNFVRLFQGQFPTWFQNSLVVAVATTVIGLTLAALAAYAFSRFPFRGSRTLSTLFLFIQLFPVAVVIIPLFMLWTSLTLTNTYWSLIVTYLVFGLPISTWLLIGFFNAVPVELEEAAMIDGSSRLGALWRVTLPLSLPGLAATAIYVFLLAWNEFFFALTFMNSTEMRTIPVGIESFFAEHSVDWGLVMAGSVVASVPVVVLFGLLSRYFIQGLTSGAVKG
ncbi:MAG TPA: carbohydrate ABC transporter permease [Chloroflexota bacterium]|jgi:ABC-type glycerol-3-phosphate transport system permease component|nr:carbohydrate ABC transporter permease [Chloroflexota bacterium]